MATAKDIRLAPITSAQATALIKRVHYSGKVVQNSQLHIGVFLRGRLEGAMSFGPPMAKRNSLPLVEGTPWNGMLELNRMAFTDALPRNSESRAIAVAMRLLRKHAPHVQWVLSFADATQCGDGTIYRASGFLLTGINSNKTIYRMPDGARYTDITLRTPARFAIARKYGIEVDGGASLRPFIAAGARVLEGFQLRYIYPLHDDVVGRLTVPVLPYSAIDEAGARMYRGDRACPGGGESGDHPDNGGSTPTLALE